MSTSALVSDSIPYMVQGISQQPDQIRKPYQGDIQINAQSSIVDALNKRPPTEHVAKILTNASSNIAAHLIDRGTNDRYIVVVQSNNTLSGTSVKAFNADTGAESTITVSVSDLTYFVCDDPRLDLRFLTVLDDTYILNRKITTAMTTDRSPNVTFTEEQKFSDLSTSAATGSIHKIIGDDNDKFSTFYVEKKSGDVFEETVAPNNLIRLDGATLPHKLVKNGAAFTLNKNTWTDRVVGDDDTNPNPKFISKTLNGMFFFKSRFGLIADQTVSFTESNKFDNFFRTTVTTTTDADPIETDVTHTRISEIEHAIPFNEQLMLFSTQSQFFVESNGPLAGDTISVNPASEFEMDVKLAPIGSGVNVYFAQANGAFSRIRELFVATDTNTHDAADITAHVPQYVPKNLHRAAASSSEDVIYFLSSENANRIYCYKYNWAGTEKNQSAWSFFELESTDTILWIEIVENITYLVISRADGVYLETMDYQVSPDTNLDFNARIDRKVALTGSFNAGTNTTTWTIPYVVPTATDMVVVKRGTGADKGASITNTRPTTTTVTATGDFSSQVCLVGIPYLMQFRFSKQYIREGTGVSTAVGEKMTLQTGRLQMRRWTVAFQDTGFFVVEVQPEGRDLKSYTYDTKIVSLTSAKPDRVQLQTGAFTFPIMAENTAFTCDLKTDSYLPAQFIQAEWEGFFVTHTTRM